MAITAQNASYVTNGPVASGQVMVASGQSSVELAYIGTATFAGDGTLTSGVLNYIDGTNTLPFTPSGVLCARVGGTAAAAIVAYAADNADSGKTATVTFSAAPAAAATVKVAFFVLK